MIDGIKITPLRQILDERGKVMHMLRADAEHFIAFGEIYFSTVDHGVVKGWQQHTKMHLNYAVISGKIKLVLFDDRKESPSHGEIQEFFMGPDNYFLLTVPPFIWYGFKGLSTEPAIIANCATIPHEQGEAVKKATTTPDIPYDWNTLNR